jgi:hypothetical protein
VGISFLILGSIFGGFQSGKLSVINKVSRFLFELVIFEVRREHFIEKVFTWRGTRAQTNNQTMRKAKKTSSTN